jgi:hybrid polyketide synthase/nonribosomal peptide synthetase FtdB
MSGDPAGRLTFESELSVATLPFLADHRIQEATVLPAAAFLEMALAAATALGPGPHAVVDVRLERALTLPDRGSRRVRFVLEPDGPAQAVFEVRAAVAAGEQVHARGRLRPLATPPVPAFDLAAARERCRDELAAADLYRRLARVGFAYGPAFRSVAELWRGRGEALGRIRPPAGLLADAGAYHLHPAVLDACLQVVAAVLPREADGTATALLPAAIGQFWLRRPAQGPLWAHAAARPAGDGQAVEADVTVFDDGGAEVAGVERLVLRPLPEAGTAAHPYRLRWRERERRPSPQTPATGGAWVVLADAAGLGDRLAALLRERGQTTVAAAPGPGLRLDLAAGSRLDPTRPEHLAALLERLDRDGPGCAGAVYLWSLDTPTADQLDAARLERASTRACTGLLHLVQALAGRRPAPLWVVTRGAQPVEAAETVPGLAQAPLWGMARTLRLELPELRGGLVDLDPAAQAGEELPLLDALLDGDGEAELAFRGGRRLVPRLEPVVAGGHEPPRLRPDATYLISGGLGAFGLRLARWLVTRGARRLVLLGRSRPDATAAGAAGVRDLQRAGARVYAATADVADRGQVAALLERLAGEGWPPVRGVVHAAGVLADGGLADLDAAALAAALRPKASGGLVLDELLRGPLDFFVCCSSVAALLGSPGQSAYAGANAFLDAFAHRRQAAGRPGTSVGWWAVAGTGMAAASPLAARLRSLGVPDLEPDAALALLPAALRPGGAHLAVLPVAPAQWPALSAIGGSPLLVDLVDGDPPGRAGLRGELLAAPREQRAGRLVAYLREVVATVGELDPAEVDPERPVAELGLDSLMAMEVRRRVAADLGALLPIGVLLEGPSVIGLAGRLVEELDGDPAPAATPDAAETAAPFPLSRGQAAMWFLRQLAPESAAYHLGDAVAIRGPLDLAALERAFARLVARHPALRTTFGVRDGVPFQRIDPTGTATVERCDAAGWDDADLHRRLVSELERLFDLERGPVVRLSVCSRSPVEHYLVLVLHHIVGELWALILLVQELSELYRAETAGTRPRLRPLPRDYRDYVRWEAELLAGPDGERLAAWWRGKLAGPPPALTLPTDRPRPPVKTYAGALRAFRLGGDLTTAVKDLARAEGATLFAVLLAAFAALLHRSSGQDDVVIGSPVSGRTRPEWEGVVGYFDNPLPLRLDLSGQPSFRDLVGRSRRVVLEALEHRDLPLPAIVEQAQPHRDPGRNALFDVMFVLRQSHVGSLRPLTLFAFGEAGAQLDLGAGFELAAMDLPRRTAQLDLTLAISEADGELHGSWEYNTDLFDTATIDRLTGHLERLLRAAVADPDRPVAALPLLTAPERALLDRWNATAASLPEELLHQGFERQAARAPEALAVVDGRRRQTYGTLEQEARALGAWLRARGARPGELVAVTMEKGWEQVVAVLAVVKAGAAYLPLDPAWPAERLRHLLERCDVRHALTQPQVDARLAWPAGVERFAITEAALERLPAVPLPPVQRPSDLAYVLFTSGSTGLPKGVMIEHRGAVNTIADVNRRFGVGPGDRVLALSSLCFDLSVYDVFGLLAAGGAVVLPDADATQDPASWVKLLAHEGVTIWNSVPALLQLLVDAAGGQGLGPHRLRLALLSGDWIPVGLPEQVRALAPGLQVIGMGGATEASIWSILQPIGAVDPAWASIPYGRPMANQRFHVLNPALEPCPVGVVGELAIAGAGLARGYWRDPERTAASFIAHPATGERLYRTGDLGRWLPDGTIEFLGRADSQVKLHGHRIELGEVEAALARLDGVQEAVAAVREDDPGRPRLVAYVVARAGSAVTAVELQAALRTILPDYLVPSAVVLLDRLPLNPNGKVDRRALPSPERLDPAGRGEPYQAPTTERERRLAAIWAAVLRVARVGRHDDFFALGGDSVLGIQVSVRARQAGLHFTPRELFGHATVAELAEVAEERPAGAVEPAPNPPAGVPAAFPLARLSQQQLDRLAARFGREGTP